MAGILLLLFVLISLFCIGLVCFSHNLRINVRLYFAFAILFVILWLVFLYFSNLQTGWALFFNRGAYAWPIVALLFFGLFVGASYPKSKQDSFWTKANIISVIAAGATVCISLTNLNVADITPRTGVNGAFVGFNVVPGRLAILVGLSLLGFSVALITRVVLTYRRVEERQKRPLRIILLTLLLCIFVSLTTDVLGPLISGGSSIGNALSNIAVIIFIASVAYSALRYSFLDIRLYVLRALVYSITLISLGLAYAGVTSFFVTQILNIRLSFGAICMLALVTSLVAVSFQPLKEYFDRRTSRLFFRDYYNPQDLLNEFSRLLARTVEIQTIKSTSGELITRALKPAHFQYLLTAEVEKEEDQNFLKLLFSSGLDQIVTDEIDERRYSLLLKALKVQDVDMAVRLRTTHGNLGFMIFGFRRSGGIYSKQDRRIMNILADEIAVGLQNALRFQEIRRFNETLQLKIEEATRQLRHTNTRLRSLDQTKDDFISMASHQLRTPLTSVKGYVSMVLDGDAGRINPLQRKLLNQSFISAQRMVYLISDLLNVSRLKTGKFIIESISSDLSQVVAEEVAQLAESAKGRGLELVYHKPERFPVLMLDETKLRQVIMNFIDNALYYTPSGGHIDVYLKDMPQSIEFTVVDDGMGVPKSEQHHLFSKFYRAHNAKRARPDGTGLGLFMARKVIVAQGGSTIFRSQEGKGSTFGFTLSKSRLQAPPSASPPSPTE